MQVMLCVLSWLPLHCSLGVFGQWYQHSADKKDKTFCIYQTGWYLREHLHLQQQQKPPPAGKHNNRDTWQDWTEKYVSKESKSTTAPDGDYWPRSWPETEEKGHLNLSTQHKVHAACLNNQSYFTN